MGESLPSEVLPSLKGMDKTNSCKYVSSSQGSPASCDFKMKECSVVIEKLPTPSYVQAAAPNKDSFSKPTNSKVLSSDKSTSPASSRKYHYSSQESIASESNSDQDVHGKWSCCKGCGKDFARLYVHLLKNNKCSKNYDMDKLKREMDNEKRENARIRKQKSRLNENVPTPKELVKIREDAKIRKQKSRTVPCEPDLNSFIEKGAEEKCEEDERKGRNYAQEHLEQLEKWKKLQPRRLTEEQEKLKEQREKQEKEERKREELNALREKARLKFLAEKKTITATPATAVFQTKGGRNN